jgi:hypothetical protein
MEVEGFHPPLGLLSGFWHLSTNELLNGIYLSFNIKNNLTNRIYWVIPCGMNVTEMFQKANPRLTRIQKVSGIFRTIFLIVAIVLCASAGFLLIALLSVHGTHRVTLLLTAGVEFACAACAWLCYKLFDLYSHGDLFTPQAVGYIRRIGWVYFLMAVVSFFVQIATVVQHGENIVAPQPSSAEWGGLVMRFVITAFPSFLIIFVAWIMDEGRKIQEEQALTV